MATYISHFSALNAWNFPLAHQYFSAEIERAGWKQLTVFRREERRRINGVFPSLCDSRYANHGLIFENGNAIVSPELMFVQLAVQLDLRQTIILGHLMCSHLKGPVSQLCFRKERLLTFVQQAEKLHGSSQASRALQYVEEGACSIMEIFLHLFLSLPNHMGGLGLSGGVFNYEVTLDAKAKAALGQQSCFIDYCFPELKIAYEYLGEQHNRTVNQDSLRTQVLRSLGYNIVTVTASQLYTPLSREHFFAFVLKQHGVYQRIRTEKYELNLQRLHELLPRLGR
ncbi:MAG: DUF559 domain-containing protein [Bacillota bacterium]|nr:DUF559 domain-containing protein [Bacillota bacterium]